MKSADSGVAGLSISARQWTIAFGAAVAAHAVFFAAALQLGDDMERGRGSPSDEFGTAMLSLSGNSELLQELAPRQTESVTEPLEPVEERAAVETAESQRKIEVKPISDSSIAFAVPVETLARPAEIEPVPEPRQKQAAPRGQRKKTSQSANTRKGGGANGRAANAAGAAAFSNYSGLVRARVLGRASSPGGSGTVVVRFTVTSSGGVAAASVVRGATGALNSAALRAVRGGFPPIPAGLPRSLSFTLPIRFR